MDSLDDEEVIFPNSQLHQYLRGLNLSEDEFGIDNLETKFHTEKTATFHHESREQISQKEKILFQEFIQQIQLCRCVSEDDARFLQNFQTENEQVVCDGSNFRSHYSSRYFPVVIGILSTAVSLYHFRTHFKFLGCSVSLLFLPFARTRLIRMFDLILNCQRNHVAKFRRELTATLAACEHFCCRLARTLRYLEEVNILRRGFTLNMARTNLTKVADFQSQRMGLCDTNFELRCDLFLLVRQIFRIFRQSTRKLVMLVPLISALDNESSYAAFINLAEFGDLLSESSDLRKLATDTSNFSIAAIKSISQLCDLQISEFLRRLAMCFCAEYWNDPRKTSDSNVFILLHPILHNANERITSATSVLDRTYNLLRTSSQIKALKDTKPSNFIKPNASNFIVNIIHSLTLHLQNSFESAFNLEQYLGNLKEVEMNDEKQWENIEESLGEIKRQIDTCQLCLEEGSNLLDKRKNPSQGNIMKLCNIDLASLESAQFPKTIHRLDVEDPIDDQVFEAYVPNSDPMDSEVCSYEQSDEAKVDLEATSRMFKELKSVLVAKAAEFRYREAKAQGIEEPPAPDETPLASQTNDNYKDPSSSTDSKNNDHLFEIPTPISDPGFNFMKDLAMLAVRKSQQFSCQQETFVSEDNDVTSDQEDSE